MAETAMTAVLSKVAELASREVQVLLKVGGDIMLLRDRLEWLQAFVRDADRKRRLGTDDFTQVLVRQTRDVAFEAEDTLDEFFHKVDIKSQVDNQNILVKYLTGCTTQISVRHGLSGQIKRIISRLDQLTENRKEYPVENVAAGAWTSSITSVLPRAGVKKLEVGLETTWSNLDGLLRQEESNKLVYISVLGESGIGKSKLMRMAINKQATLDHFDVVMYCIMPPNSSVDAVVKQLLSEAKNKIKEPAASGGDNLSVLLREKRYLVVLDGISSKSVLNCIKACFPDDKKGSRVVLILEPESEEVAKHAAKTLNGHKHSGSIIRLSRMNETNTVDLLYAIVDGVKQKKDDTKKKDVRKDTKEKEDNKGNREVQKANGATEMPEQRYRRQIFEITGGLPLAVVVLSGLLRSKEKPVEWDAVLQQFMPAGGEVNETDETLGKDTPASLDALLHRLTTPKTEVPKLSSRMAIERIFSASFDDLPNDLKTCFLYFAAFAKNTELDTATIVRMWAAEGFIKPEMGKTLEELGQKYIRELVSRCLLNVHRTTVTVHSRLTRFLQSEAREASFIEIHDNTSVLAPGAVRRLSIQNDQGNVVSFGYRFPKLRSFICRITDTRMDRKKDVSAEGSTKKKDKSASPIKFLYGSKFLRLLSISGVILTELPSEICDMIHLRYLAINCDGLKKLPDRIDRLINLQTLDIRNSEVESIAEDFWKIKTLRHVFAKQLQLNLPRDVERLDNELQTLHGVKPAAQQTEVSKFPYYSQKKKEVKSPLELMTSLVSLEMDLHGFETAEHEKALGNLQLLQHLELQGDNIPPQVFLSGVHLQRLESLVIYGIFELDEKADSARIKNSLPNLVNFQVKNSRPNSGN